MTDPIIAGGTAIVAAYLSKDGIEKVLGPTAAYLGNNIKDFVEKRHRAFDEIFTRAKKRLGKRIENPGTVPARVLKEIINDATYSEDNVTLEYYAGVLASSRTPSGSDDRGARIAKLISNMSSYQLRGHYLLYRAFVETFRGDPQSLDAQDGRNSAAIMIDFDALHRGLGLEDNHFDITIWQHILFGLERDALIFSMEIRQGSIPNRRRNRKNSFFGWPLVHSYYAGRRVASIRLWRWDGTLCYDICPTIFVRNRRRRF